MAIQSTEVVGQRGLQLDTHVARARVVERKMPSVEGCSGDRLLVSWAVPTVSEQWPSLVRELRPDLVAAPRGEGHLESRDRRAIREGALGQGLVLQNRELSPSTGGGHLDAVSVPVLVQPMLQLPGSR